MSLILASLAAIALAAPVLALHYLIRLPEAPACPSCQRITTQDERRRGLGADRVLAVVWATQVRRCTACGWVGRMRWRWAVQKEGGRGS